MEIACRKISKCKVLFLKYVYNIRENCYPKKENVFFAMVLHSVWKIEIAKPISGYIFRFMELSKSEVSCTNERLGNGYVSVNNNLLLIVFILSLPPFSVAVPEIVLLYM
jgi:hypothetical protein